MLKNYFITTIRFFNKNKLSTFINIMGLTIGITCALLVFLFVQFEWSVDQFHHKIDKIYRLLIVGEVRDSDSVIEYRSDIIESRVRFLQKFPEVMNIVRLSPWSGKVEHKNKWIRENRFWFTDPHIFDMLTLPLKSGNPETVLQAPNSVVITPHIAAKYFGEEDPIGKTIKIHMSVIPIFYNFKVTGILEPLPKASSLKIDFLAYIPFERLTQERRDFVGRLSEYMHVQTLVELGDPSTFKLVQKKVGEIYCHDVYKSSNLQKMKYQLEPFKKAYLDSKATFFEPDSAAYFEDVILQKRDKRLFFILLAIGGIILSVSCINIINLITAPATLRAKEIGIRKVVGAKRRQLIFQFITETILLSYLSLLLALLLTELLLPSFNTLIRRELSVNYATNWIYLFGMVGIATLAGILSGVYPAFILSSLKPATAMQGHLQQTSKLLRKGLVIVQIGLCVIVFLFVLVMLDEVKAFKNRDIGFNSHNLIFFQLDDNDLVEHYPAFKKEILGIPGVTNMAASNFVPWKYGLMESFAYYHNDAVVRAQTIFADTSFTETYQIPIVDGEEPSTKRTVMPGYVMINEAARKILQSNGTDPLSKSLDIPLARFIWQHRVLGIMQDFNYFFPTKSVKPLAILPSYHMRYIRNFVTIRLADGNHTNILSKIEKTVKRFFPQALFDYKYVAKEMEKMHTQNIGYYLVALKSITGFCIFIAAVGLFGFTSYESERSTKEIGIRKALGAKPMQITMHLIFRFAKLTLIANVIAWPIFYLIIQWILKIIHYPHPIYIGFTRFLLAGLLTLVLTIVVVCVKAYQAALVDPAKALRYE